MTFQPIEIIGGGLAGLSLALALRRAGVPVTVFEAGIYPRHRVCGEFITGLAPRTRARLGLDAFLTDAVINRDVTWFLRDRRTQTHRLPAAVPGLSRHALDARLADAFVAAGGDLRTNTRATALTDAPGRVFATGRRRAHSPWLGLKFHALDLPLASDLELHLGAHAYIGLARIEHGRVNVCGLFQHRTLRAKGLPLILGYLRADGLHALADRLASASVDPASFCAVTAVDFDRRVLPTAELRLGDAGATIPPFTGHGMAMAFQSAEIALDPLLAFARGELDWTSARREIHTALRRSFRLRLASAGALHSFLLEPARQRWLAALSRARLLPFRPLFAALH